MASCLGDADLGSGAVAPDLLVEGAGVDGVGTGGDGSVTRCCIAADPLTLRASGGLSSERVWPHLSISVVVRRVVGTVVWSGVEPEGVEERVEAGDGW